MPLVLANTARPQASAVTYSRAGATAGTILKELSPKVGLNLAATPATEGEILCVSVHDAPVSALLEKIAWAVSGSWKREGNDYRLVRTAIDARTEAMRERRRTIEAMGKALVAKRLELGKAPAFDDQESVRLARRTAAMVKSFNPTSSSGTYWKSMQEIGRETPVGRALDRILCSFRAEELADLPVQRRVIFASNPTRMQRPFGDAISSIVGMFRKEQGIWSETVSRLQVESPKVGNTTYVVNGLYGASEPIESFGKILVAVTRLPMQPTVQFELMVSDNKGKMIAQGNATLSLANFNYPELQREAKPNESKVQGSPDAVAIGKALQEGVPLPPDVRQRLLNPEVYEPLGTTMGAILLSISEGDKVNIVANMEDIEFYAGAFQAKALPTSSFRTMIGTIAESEDAPGWYTLRPFEGIFRRKNRIDRRLLGGYLRRVAELGEMSVEESAAWAAKMPTEERDNLVSALRRVLGINVDGRQDMKWLHFYGTLTPYQRKLARADGLPVSALDADQYDQLEGMIYGERSMLQLDYQKAQEAKFDSNLFYSGIFREATESLPNGLPRDGLLNLSSNTAEVCFAPGKAGTRYASVVRAFTATDLGWNMYMAASPEQYPSAQDEYNQIDSTRLRYGQRTQIIISFRFTPLLTLQSSLEERNYGNSKPRPYAELPAAFREKVEAYMEMQRKSSHGAMPERSTPNSNPPPP